MKHTEEKGIHSGLHQASVLFRDMAQTDCRRRQGAQGAAQGVERLAERKKIFPGGVPRATCRGRLGPFGEPQFAKRRSHHFESGGRSRRFWLVVLALFAGMGAAAEEALGETPAAGSAVVTVTAVGSASAFASRIEEAAHEIPYRPLQSKPS